MIQEDEQLLSKDLCARLPYGVICSIYRIDDDGVGWRNEKLTGHFSTGYANEFYFGINPLSVDDVSKIKPYLRPMSSMTEEEKEKYHSLCYEEEREVFEYGEWVTRVYYHDTIDSIDYLNSIHIDYRGLIEKGLAIEVTEDNNPYKLEE